MSKNIKDVFAGTNNQVVDTNFTFRRTKRQPLDDSQIIVSYEALKKEMEDPNSTIYKGQIVVTQGPEKDKTPINFTPFLIKNDEAKNTSYYADRIPTASYMEKYLDEIYVKKIQLGITYTGVGQWEDVKGTDGSIPTTSYSEIFNDYNTNSVGVKPGFTRDAQFAHVEGSNNVTYGDTSHVEGDNNTNYGTSSHIEGGKNNIDNNSDYSHAEGYNNHIEENSAYSHVEGYNNTVTAKGAHAQGVGTFANGEGSFSGGYNTKANGTYSTALGISSQATESGAVALGQNTKAEGVSSLTAGSGSIAKGDFSVAFGNSTYAEKTSSFTAGNATYAQGDYSVAFGDNTYAQGISSLAEGSYTYAIGNFSHAEGQDSHAVGISSHAEGYGTYANGNFSHVEGNENTSGGHYSHTEGLKNQAIGEATHVEGAENIANGNYSHIEGSSNNSYTDSQYTHIEGLSNKAKDGSNYSHLEGQENTSYSKYSHIEGYDNTAESTASNTHIEGSGNTSRAQYAHIEGELNIVETTGRSSHVEGNQNIASGNYTHAEGHQNTASGESSHVEGGHNESSGLYSHSEGLYTKANGIGSHAEGGTTEDIGKEGGSYTIADGDFSHAEGFITTANGVGAHTEGFFTVSGTFDNTGKRTQYGHAEGAYTYAAGDYSHTEGVATRTYGSGSHAQGLGTIATGDYSTTTGSYTQAFNKTETSFGTYNRSYMRLSDGSTNKPITSIPNEFARLNGKYIAGRYPSYTASADGTYYYDVSYETVFTIGDGLGDEYVDGVNPLDIREDGSDAGQQAREGRHNIMDIRKNGQMYYSGGIIAGGEIVAPMSYSYVASLGPTAYFTTIMAALLTQPEYYRPYLQRNFGGDNQNFTNGKLFETEVGSTVSFNLYFTAHRVAYDTHGQLDPLYGVELGNMLGYSRGITNVTYQVIPNNGTGSVSQANNMVTYTKNYTYGEYTVTATDKTTSVIYGYLAGKVSKPKDKDLFAYNPSGANNIKSDTYISIVKNLMVGTADTYTLWKGVSYEYAGASQMYFQQLAEKGTYIGAAGQKPYEKFNNEKYTGGGTITINGYYKYYYGTFDDTWKTDFNSINWDNQIKSGSSEYMKSNNQPLKANSVVEKTFNISSTKGLKGVWFAVPAALCKMIKYDSTKSFYLLYANKLGKATLDTGWSTNTDGGGALPLYTTLTNNTVSVCGLRYRIFCCMAKGLIAGGDSCQWGFKFKYSDAESAKHVTDVHETDTPLTEYYSNS